MKILTITKSYRLLMIALVACIAIASANAKPPLDEREQAQVVDQLLEQRIQNLMPQLMRRSGIDMWVLISREYNEDPVLRTLLPSDWYSARRRTILVLFDRGVDEQGQDLGVEALAVARYDVGTVFKRAWDPEAQPDQWLALRDLINA